MKSSMKWASCAILLLLGLLEPTLARSVWKFPTCQDDAACLSSKTYKTASLGMNGGCGEEKNYCNLHIPNRPQDIALKLNKVKKEAVLECCPETCKLDCTCNLWTDRTEYYIVQDHSITQSAGDWYPKNSKASAQAACIAKDTCCGINSQNDHKNGQWSLRDAMVDGECTTAHWPRPTQASPTGGLDLLLSSSVLDRRCMTTTTSAGGSANSNTGTTGCAHWCAGHTLQPWSEKCAYETKACDGCDECQKKTCAHWCDSHSKAVTWKVSCAYSTLACLACPECQMQGGSAGWEQESAVKPAQTNPAPGYAHCPQGWYDASQQGVCNDFCRWVGNSECNAHPYLRKNGYHTDQPGKPSPRGGWWSCALAGETNGYDMSHPNWGPTTFPKCSGRGAVPPSAGTYGVVKAADDTSLELGDYGEYGSDQDGDDFTMYGSDHDGQSCDCDCSFVGTGTDLNRQYLCKTADVCYNLVEGWCAEDEHICNIPN